MTRTTQITESLIRRVAAEHSVDPRTVRRVLRGEPVRGLAGERAHAALAAAGLTPPTTTSPEEQP